MSNNNNNGAYAPLERDAEHLAILEKVWFTTFDDMFTMLNEHVNYVKEIGTYQCYPSEMKIESYGAGYGIIEINIHENCDKKLLARLIHYLREGQSCAGLRNSNISEKLDCLLTTNVMLELLDNGVDFDIAELYCSKSFSGAFDRFYDRGLFRQYIKERVVGE